MMMSIFGCCLLRVCFQILSYFTMDSRPTVSSIDPGAQNGHETQCVFSEGDVRQSDADDIRPRVVGKYFIP